MKQILKLAELNMALVMANRAEIEARKTKDEDAIEAAKSSVETAQARLDDHLNGKRLANEFDKYENKKDEVRAALIAAGHDTAVMDFF